MDSSRFWAKAVRNASDCWEWTGYRQSKGYGRFNVDGKTRFAHRVAYELTVGPIPEGMVIDHLCRNRGCVNPAHLEVVTPGENTRRGVAGAVRSALAAAQTHCIHGHPLTEENLIRFASGRRRCRICRAMELAGWRARNVARGLNTRGKPRTVGVERVL